jgi:toxin secretion/phage lysis holin
MIRSTICSFLGVLGSGIAYLFGGFDNAIITLFIFMVIDYITGLIVAGVFHKSNKSETGSLESKAGWKGLCKKGVTLLIVVIANRLDMQLGSNYIRDAVCIGFMLNELISIIENAGLMGIKLPAVLTKAIEILKEKE